MRRQRGYLLDAVGDPNGVTNAVLTLDDAASASLTANTVTNGTYLPTDLDTTRHSFNPPAPTFAYGNTLLPLGATGGARGETRRAP